MVALCAPGSSMLSSRPASSAACFISPSTASRGLYVQVLEFFFEVIHQGGDLLKIHRLHCGRHPFHHSLHRLGNFLGGDCRLHPACSGVHSCGHPQIIEGLVFLPDRILSMDFCNLHVSLLYGLLQFKFFCLFFLVAFLGIPLQLLCSKLQVEEMLFHRCHRHLVSCRSESSNKSL